MPPLFSPGCDSHCAHCVSDNTSFNLYKAEALASRSPSQQGTAGETRKVSSRGGLTALPLTEFGADLTLGILNPFLLVKRRAGREEEEKNPKPHREVSSSPFIQHIRTEPAFPWARWSCTGVTPAHQVGAR